MSEYGWITDEAFRSKLCELLDEMEGDELLAIPGLYEVVSEELNNQVLEALAGERKDVPIVEATEAQICQVCRRNMPRPTEPVTMSGSYRGWSFVWINKALVLVSIRCPEHWET